MRLLRVHDMSLDLPGDVFRQSVLPSSLVGLLTLGVSIFLGVKAHEGSLQPQWVVVCACAFSGLFSLFFLAMARKGLRKSNWTLISRDEGLYIKFRSYLNDHFPPEDPVILAVPSGEILGIKKTTERRETPGAGDRGQRLVQRFVYLDIVVSGDLSEANRALGDERRKKAPKIGISRTRYHHYPLKIVLPDTLRITWKSPQDLCTPGIDAALRSLGQRFAVLEELSLDSGPPDPNDRKAIEDRILELIQSGNKMAAMKAARKLYGWDLRTAKDFVEELAER